MVNGEQATRPFVHVLVCDSCLFESLWQGGAAHVSAGTLLPKHAHMLTHACARYEPAMLATDAAVTAGLEAGGLAVHSFNTLLLREPGRTSPCSGRVPLHISGFSLLDNEA